MVFLLRMSHVTPYCHTFHFSWQPTSMRAIRARYDPYLQTRHRVEQVGVSTYYLDIFYWLVLLLFCLYLPQKWFLYKLAANFSVLFFGEFNSVSVLYVITFVVSCFVCCAQLKQLGHSVDKVEFIVMGGTFMALPEDYRDYFIRNLHDALSGHTSNNVAEAVRYQVIQWPVSFYVFLPSFKYEIRKIINTNN